MTFSNVKVPTSNIIGTENGGFKIVMYGFNLERFLISSAAVSYGMVCVNESISYAKSQNMLNNQIIKHKIANMSLKVISCHSLLERIAYQLKFDNLGIKDKSLSRNLALLKVCCSRMVQYCCVEASKIFGEKSYDCNGKGSKVDRMYRSVRASAIAGGSEEVLLDFAVRTAKL